MSLSEVKQRGRRRAAAPTAHELAPVMGSRRQAIAVERSCAETPNLIGSMVRAGLANGAGQKVGIALAATGLALAVTLPTTPGIATAGNETKSGFEQEATVTAAANTAITFDAPALASALNKDGQLKETLKVQASKVTPQAAKGTLSAPLKTLSESSGFGSRINPLTGQPGEVHTGQDYAVASGTEVLAAASGTVTFSAWHNFGGGNRVVVDHGNGLSTSYNHMSSNLVKVGQKVERGDVVGLSGSTGASTGPHLHFEVIVDDATVDPHGWL